MIDQGQAMDLPRHIKTGDPYPLRGLVGFGLNYRMFPDSSGFLEAIQQLDFIVDVDPYATDTSKYADIVLPACSSVERSEVRCYPQKYVIFTQPVIAPLGEARSDHDIIFALATSWVSPTSPATSRRVAVISPTALPTSAKPSRMPWTGSSNRAA